MLDGFLLVAADAEDASLEGTGTATVVAAGAVVSVAASIDAADARSSVATPVEAVDTPVICRRCCLLLVAAPGTPASNECRFDLSTLSHPIFRYSRCCFGIFGIT